MLLPRMTALVALLALATCGSRSIALVQEHHGHEFHCDRRYVHVEHGEGARFVSRGCGFEADWDCRDRRCELIDSRAHGMAGP